jgi:hypothetical protein
LSRFVCPVADKIGGNYTLLYTLPGAATGAAAPVAVSVPRRRSAVRLHPPELNRQAPRLDFRRAITGQFTANSVPTFGIEQTDNDSAPHNFRMDKKKTEARPPQDLQIEALGALEQARAMPHGPARSEALKRAGILQNEADMQGLQFAKRGRPPKS